MARIAFRRDFRRDSPTSAFLIISQCHHNALLWGLSVLFLTQEVLNYHPMSVERLLELTTMAQHHERSSVRQSTLDRLFALLLPSMLSTPMDNHFLAVADPRFILITTIDLCFAIYENTQSQHLMSVEQIAVQK